MITLSLAENIYPYTIEHVINNVALSRTGDLTIALPSGSSSSYYLVINHRNSLETWSAFPVNLDVNHQSYDFTDGINKAFGNNMLVTGNSCVIFSGEVNQGWHCGFR
ncbi:MAG: hypothetical protein IPH45_19035 [Bacteroidales bacterium]|nr:hypothetical protein [Bacteroidales bacterium]